MSPNIPFIKFDLVQLGQFAIFFLERFRAMMVALPWKMRNYRRQVWLAQRKMHRMRSPWFLTRRYATNQRWAGHGPWVKTHGYHRIVATRREKPRHIAYEEADGDAVYPVTAYDAPRR